MTYVATGPGREAGDPEWAARVAVHRARGGCWAGGDGGDHGPGRGAGLCVGGAADRRDGHLAGRGDGRVRNLGRVGEGAARLAARIGGLVGAWRGTRADVVAVSDEAGLGVVPATSAGRLFRDELGRLYQVLAAESEEAELVVAGRVVPLGPG